VSILLGGTPADPNALLVGESTLPRQLFAGAVVTPASGNVRLTYFTATKTELISQVRTFSGGTAAAATPTLCKVGIYSVADNGDLTRIASTANDTTLWSATNTAYTRSLLTSFTKVAGQRYAVGQLCVSGVAMPAWPATTFSAGTEWSSQAPRISATHNGQTDLPATIPNPAGVNSQMIYTVVLP
jgi:hypothetical protein